MNQFFGQYFVMALEVSLVILVTLAVRPLIKKVSHRAICLLWLVVLFRMLCPVTVEGPIPAFWNEKETGGRVVAQGQENTLQDAWRAGTVKGTDEIVKMAEVRPERTETARLPEEGLVQGSEEMPGNVSETEGKAGVPGYASETEGKADGTLMQVETQEESGNSVQKGTESNVPTQEGADPERQTGNGQMVNSDGSSNGLAMDTQPGVNEWLAEDDQTLAWQRAYFQSVPGKSLVNVCGVIWLFGAVLFFLFGAWNYWKLTQRLRESLPLRTWEKYPVRISDASGVPMSFGVFHRGIYLPEMLRAETKEQEMILRHEAMHLRRMDPLRKLLALLGLCLHWWNPLAWLCVSLMNKDMEMACDEGVLTGLGEEGRGEYAKVLLQFAKHRSGLSLAAAFGESNAESRIREVLKYRKKPLWLTAGTVCLVLVLGGCLATKPRDVSEEVEASEAPSAEEAGKEEAKQPEENRYGALEITADGYYVYATEDELWEGWKERFRDLLLQAGKIRETDLLVQFRDERHSETMHPAKHAGEHFSSRPEAYAVSENGEVLQFSECLDYYEEQGKYWLGEVTWQDNAKVESLEQAVLFGPFFLYGYREMETPENVPELFLDSDDYRFCGLIAGIFQEKAPQKDAALKDPVTAVTELMHLQGGKGEVQPETIGSNRADQAIVTYEFADGSKANYHVQKRGDHWFPYYLEESTKKAREDYPEEYGPEWPGWEDAQEKRRKILEIMEAATAKELRSVTERVSVSDAWYVQDASEGGFRMVDEIPEMDVALYGLSGGSPMILRKGESVYPVWINWDSLRAWPEIHAGDYDGDGETEYALITTDGTGTGVSKQGLYVIELQDGEAVVHPFSETIRRSQLEKRLTYEYREKDQRLTLYLDRNTAGQKLCGLWLKDRLPEEWLQGNVRIGFGDIESMAAVDDKLFYEVVGGIASDAEDAPFITYDAAINLNCQVQYHADGSFTVGRINAKAEYWHSESEQESGAAYGEEVLYVDQADLTRDGTQDLIVTSVTFGEENKALPWNSRMEQGEICFVRVYDGNSLADGMAYNPGTYAKTGGFHATQAIWEHALADVHVGNGMVLVCEKDGKSYLLTGGYPMGQGDLVPWYEVIALGGNGEEYVLDEAETFVSMNNLGEDFPVEDMAAFTEKLDQWIGKGRLIALTDAYLGVRISVNGGIGQWKTTAAGNGKQAKFNAWEIWAGLYHGVEQNVFEAMADSREAFSGAPKLIALTGMGNLRESLSSLNENWKAWADWWQSVNEKAKITVEHQDGKNVITCFITHDGMPDTITVDYAAAKEDSQKPVIIDVRNWLGEILWEGELGLPKAGWGKYYLTIYQGLPYLIYYWPVTEMQGITDGGYKIFYLDSQGREQVIRENVISSEKSKDFEADRAKFEEELKPFMSKATLLISTWEGELGVEQKPSNW